MPLYIKCGVAEMRSHLMGDGWGKEEEATLNLGKKILAALSVVILLAGMVPAASATEVTEETEYTGEKARSYYVELRRQVAIGNGLNEYEYTKESWAPMEIALEEGNRLVKGSWGKKTIEDAAEAIQVAMDGLVRMDYSLLDEALANTYNEIEKNPELYSVCSRLFEASEKARPLLVSGDQPAVDAAVVELNGLLEELSQCDMEVAEPEVIIQEVEVEVLPTDDYCNIPMHRTWPVLFVISAVLNVALIVILIYVIMKKRNTIDDTPLVSYDIDDDMDF